MSNPFRYFNSSPEVIRLVVMMYVRGIVTLPGGELEASAAQELSGRCDCGPPCRHRRSAKGAMRLG
jgi:hypothetical protein